MSLILLLGLDDEVRDALRLEAARRVGRLLRARTKDLRGQEAGEFTADTRPTQTAVRELVDDAAEEVFIAAGDVDALTDAEEPAAWVVIAIRTAMLVELSYFPDQVDGEDSAYARLQELYESGLKRLLTRVGGAAPDAPSQTVSYPLTTATAAAALDLLACDLIP